MIEFVKTILFLACAAAIGALAWVARPADPGRGVIDDTGELFAPGFTDPLQADSMEIIEFDEDTGTGQVFKVARHQGVWSIPSHENYAADAENRFADAAAAMIGLAKGVNRSDQRSGWCSARTNRCKKRPHRAMPFRQGGLSLSGR